jgi:hypothetical protein
LRTGSKLDARLWTAPDANTSQLGPLCWGVAGWVMAEAYSHEVSSCGFWPGNGGYGRAAFYVYAYPEPAGYGDTRLSTAEAFYDKGLGQFILPYDAVYQSGDPDKLLLGFLQETYVAAAELAKWDRKTLERELRTTR